jgi:hypothetical protein
MPRARKATGEKVRWRTLVEVRPRFPACRGAGTRGARQSGLNRIVEIEPGHDKLERTLTSESPTVHGAKTPWTRVRPF